MAYQTKCNATPEEEAVEDLREIESLVEALPKQKNQEIQAHLFQLVDKLQDLCPYTSHAPILRKLVARFGDAYYFFNKTGDTCLLADFLSEAKVAETLISRR